MQRLSDTKNFAEGKSKTIIHYRKPSEDDEERMFVYKKNTTRHEIKKEFIYHGSLCPTKRNRMYLDFLGSPVVNMILIGHIQDVAIEKAIKKNIERNEYEQKQKTNYTTEKATLPHSGSRHI